MILYYNHGNTTIVKEHRFNMKGKTNKQGCQPLQDLTWSEIGLGGFGGSLTLNARGLAILDE